MNPAFSVIFLTTLIGAGQGLFVLLFGAQLAGFGDRGFLAAGGSVALLLMAGGLAASFFHLGRPERAWRTATMWRTSWLSREVIALPLFMAALAAWTGSQLAGSSNLSSLSGPSGLPGLAATPAVGNTLGAIALLLCMALWVSTAMVYASVRFLQEWASAYTLVNFTLLGLASGATLATALAAIGAPTLVTGFGLVALLATAAGWLSRGLSLQRNARLKPASTVQSAIGIRHPVIRQRAMGFGGGSFNTREFFHGRTPGALRQVKTGFLIGAFALPLALLAAGLAAGDGGPIMLAGVVQFLGLLAERWFFLAQANHPQNLYYQAVS